ncbi:MAG: cell envelope integrity EipB family protein [Acidisphaera sp.]|nr:cell envelope integrity EipB family protein [Acidisphaera sp.]MBV9812569.1 cell envelope integrity EipB family protein [Acetobacteraceae bacterium]
MPFHRLAAAAAGGALMLLSGTAFAAGPDLAPHRAIYDLRLSTARSNDVAAATGKMAYEVTDTCDAWATRQRLEMTVTNRDGQDVQMVSDYTTWESKDGLKLNFRMRETTDTAVTSEVQGDASLTATGGAGEVHYTLPKEQTVQLPTGTLFPTAHTAALLAAAEDGKKVIALPLFDGTSPDGAQNSSIVVTSWGGPQASKWPALAQLPSGRFHIAFFNRGAEAQTPDYEVSMRYWSNGVADDLAMDFGEFVMNGKMVEFSPQKPHC